MDGMPARERLPLIALAAGLCVVLVLVAFRGPTVDDAYLWFADIDVAEEPNVVMVDGVPRVLYAGEATPQANPVTVAQWGLEQHAKGENDGLIRAADWLVEQQRPDGSWVYLFDHPMPWAGTELEAPWISGMAQGQALSVFVRAYRVTGDRGYLRAGRAALRPLSVPVADGGALRVWRGHTFFEEYPTADRPSLVLNGFLFTLIGLHEFATETGDEDAWRLWRDGEQTAAALVALYDLGDGASTYGLAHLNGGPEPVRAVAGVYLHIHPALAAEMHALTGRSVYREMAQAWETAR